MRTAKPEEKTKIELLVVHPRCLEHAYARATQLFAWHTRQQNKVCTTLRPTGSVSPCPGAMGLGAWIINAIIRRLGLLR